jgi:hypothetical protein
MTSLYGFLDGTLECHRRGQTIVGLKYDGSKSNENETDIINHKLYTQQQQVEIANPTFSSDLIKRDDTLCP